MPMCVQGLSGVSWWAWLVLGVVLVLISLVVLRMLCATKQVDISNIYISRSTYLHIIYLYYLQITSRQQRTTAPNLIRDRGRN